MDVKVKLLKVLAIILFFIALFAGFYAYAVYQENIKIEENTVGLNEKIAKLENEIEGYKTKLNTISDILNTNLDDDFEEKEITGIEGAFLYEENGTESLMYTFEKDNVTFSANHTMKGTYVVENNKIKITYTEAKDPEGKEMEIADEEKTEELTIIDENTLEMNDVQFVRTED